MKLQSVLLSTKQTAYEYYKKQYDNLREVLPVEDLAAIKQGHDEHYASLNHIRKTLDSKGISYQRVYMPYAAYEEFKDRDLIIAVGGDGTVLNTAHYILDSTPLLAVKSEKRSVGGLCAISAAEFESALEKIMRDCAKIESWTRVEGKMGNKTDLALNEISVAHKYGGFARYEIRLNDLGEEHGGTGMLISTGSGSRAWYANIPGSDGEFPRTAEELRFIARECWKDAGYRLSKGSINKDQMIEIRSLMNIDGVVMFDGDCQKRMYDFGRGASLRIKISDKPLRMIVV